MEHGVHIRVIGNFDLLPSDLRSLMAEAMTVTKENNKAVLNIAFAYTSEWPSIRKQTLLIAPGFTIIESHPFYLSYLSRQRRNFTQCETHC